MLLLKLVSLSMTLTSAPLTQTLQTASLQDLSWMAGSWEGEADGATVDYQYGQPAGGVMLGQGRMVAGGEALFFEFETFREDGGRLTLTPAPFGQPGVTFEATLIERGHAVFTAEGHDFPHVIEYKRLADGSFYSKAQGVEDGVEKTIEFVQRRAATQGE